jgi:hypothetical protein
MTVQPLNYTPTAVTDSTGTCTFTFQQTPVTQTWTATINVPGAPDTAITTAYTNGNATAQWQGSNTYGPLQLGNGQQLSLTCTGMSPLTNYQATAIGHVFTVEQPPITWPTAYADSVTTSTQQVVLANGNAQGNGSAYFYNQEIIVTLQQTFRSITVVAWWSNVTGTGGTAQLGDPSGPYPNYITGVQSGLYYSPTSLPYLLTSGQLCARFAVDYLVDQQVEIPLNFVPPTLTGQYNWVVLGDLQDTDIAVYNAMGTSLNVAGTVTVVPSGQQHVILDSPNPLPVTNTTGTELYVRNLNTDQLYVRNQTTDQLYVKNLSTDQLYIQPATNGTMNGSVTSLGSYTISGGLPIANNSFLFGGVYFPVNLLTAPVGGATKASVSVTTATATQIVAAPASNKVLRVHNLTIRGGTAGTLVRVYCNTSGYDLWYSPINGSVSLNGQLVTTADGAIYVAASGVTTACVITVTYDTYSTPQTS